MSPRGRAGLLALVLAGTAGATGCSPAGQTAPSALPSVTPSTPEQFSAVIDQFRDGYATGTLVFQLENRSAAAEKAVRAELVDDRFDEGTVWNGDADLSPGQPISLPAVASPPRCGHTDDGVPSVRVRLADGETRLVRAEDPHAVLQRIHSEGCFSASVAASVSLHFGDTLGDGTRPGTAVLSLVAEEPRSSPSAAPVTLVSVSNTTLLDEDTADPWPREVILDPTAPPVRLAIRPARCDPHAVAEDKVGTLIPLTLRVRGSTGTVKVAAAPALRAQIYAFVARACGWSTAG
ncbi:MAG: hypothetical protein HOQ07_06810 [Sinomonas sp.]|nr:hypothetical protein [Sinomonas sp.]